MSNFTTFVRGLLVAGVVTLAAGPGAGCIDDKDDLPKGVVDDSDPPGSPIARLDGKADGATSFKVSLESAHPYANNLDRIYSLDLDRIVPPCTTRVRAHFASLRTEPRYDVVQVIAPDGRVAQSFDGRHDGAWTRFVDVGASDKQLRLRLRTDGSITDHGFRVDAIEIETALRCPAPVPASCSPGYFDVTPTPDSCTCRTETRCAEDGWVEIEHAIGGGFTGEVTGRRLTGQRAQSVRYQPAEGETTAHIGQVDRAAVQRLVTAVVDSGLLDHPEVDQPSNWNETLTVRIGTRAVSFTRPQGSFPADQQRLIEQFEALFGCDGLNAPLTCGDGFSCQEGACVEDVGCVCPAVYSPVCGVDGTTYSNGCAAACASAAVSHPGECGIAGDTCGTIRGLSCLDGYRCRFGTSQFDDPYPDASGACVNETYCDAPGDCAGLFHIAVPGVWGCDSNVCAWHAGPAWQPVTGSRLVTPHPYPNNLNTWTAIDLPAGGTRMRLVTTGMFELEQGFDKLEVWAWRNGGWLKVKTYSGTRGPALTDEFAGQYFYLHLVSDSSINGYGFDLRAEYAY